MATTVAQPTARPAGPTRRRRLAVWTLIVVASILLLATIATTFVKRQMLDDQAWEQATTQVVQDPAVHAALASYLVDQLYRDVDVPAALERQLPPNLDRLAVPLAAALRQPLTSTATFILGRPRVQQLVIGASIRAHARLVNVLEDTTGHGISTGNGVVTLDLHSLIGRLGADLGLPPQALARIPADAGVIVIMRSGQLGSLQSAVRAIKVLSVWLLVLVLVLYALAVYLARGARRAALRDVGWAVTVVGVLVLVLRRVVGTSVVDSLAASGQHVPIHHIWLIGTAILGQIGAAAILYGLVMVVGAWLAGPTSWALSARRSAAPVLRAHPVVVTLAPAGAYLLLVLWGPTHALRVWWGILLFGGLVGAGCLVLFRQTLAEFPGAGADEVEQQPAAAAAEPRTSNAEQLSRLARLHDTGAISDAEFRRAKQLVLS